MFAFQACYGTPQDFGLDVHVSGKVISGATLEGIPSIHVSQVENGNYVTTGPDGTFSFYAERLPAYNFIFADRDGDLNGRFQDKDTLVTLPETADAIDLLIQLN